MFTQTIQVDADLCTGCRACELACGFHWTGRMDPSHAAIRVGRNSRGKFEVEILDPCDVCHDRESPMCLQVCSPRALILSRKAEATASGRRRNRRASTARGISG